MILIMMVLDLNRALIPLSSKHLLHLRADGTIFCPRRMLGRVQLPVNGARPHPHLHQAEDASLLVRSLAFRPEAIVAVLAASIGLSILRFDRLPVGAEARGASN
jgi:hypothetical protein